MEKYKEYLDTAKKYLFNKGNGKLTGGICFTIRIGEIFNSDEPEEFIKNKIESVRYDFTEVCLHTDSYGVDYLLFYNK